MKTFEIVYENDEILLINKPAGVSVQGGAGISHPLDEELAIQTGYKIHLVHRLDKETAGLLVVAKNPKAASKWISLISGKQVKKEYIAICFGFPQINGKNAEKGVLTDTVTKGNRELSAVTNFKVLKSKAFTIHLENENQEKLQKELCLTSIHCTLGTGRMHQIRIHLAKAGAPIAGDDKHGNFKLNKLARKIGVKKLLLCAFRLTIPGPAGKPLTFEIPLPEHMKLTEENTSE